MVASFNLGQFLGAGAFAAITGVATAIVAYRQATRVAMTQAQAQIGVRRLENDGALHGFLHDDLKDARQELRDERAAHLSCIEIRANAEAEVKRLVDCLREAETERDAALARCNQLDYENRQLQTRLTCYEWLKDRLDIEALRRLIAMRESHPPT